MNANTSLISILSSTHGRLRREQRDIDKRDLQRALKYGTPQKNWKQRWSIDYDGITFITDPSRTKEITAFPSPLPPAEVSLAAMAEHNELIRLMKKKPTLATSHTVIIIDNSGSMLAKKNNIHLYRDSQNAAVSMTALEFVAEQLFSQTATNSDLVSLILFSSTARVVIHREPIGWVVYNKILQHRNCEKFVDRQNKPAYDTILAQSNYLPALEKATELLEEGYHEGCAASLFFYSDGCPTDAQKLRISTVAAKKLMQNKVETMAKRFGNTFTFSPVGLGDIYDDFSHLEAMAAAATLAGAKGEFAYCKKTADSITSAISSLVASTRESRLSIQEGRGRKYTQRNDLVSEDDASIKFDWQYFSIKKHFVYDPAMKSLTRSRSLPIAAVESDRAEAARRAMQKKPPYLAINAHFFGKGAERVAYRCRLSDRQGVDGFAFKAMVAKETKDIERQDEMEHFHAGFMETQDLASYLAEEFNRHVRVLPQYDPVTTPRITFLSCSVLVVHDPSWHHGDGTRGVLVEKMLDTARFPWKKWNDNAGMIDGKPSVVPIDVPFELKQLAEEEAAILSGGFAKLNLGAITEEGDEEESDDEASLDDLEGADFDSPESITRPVGVQPSDYLQAFTHFTYRYTQKRVMVCDLQGCFNSDMRPPTFELTDPAIHYASAKGRREVYGRTDKGKSGQNAFFNTHKCSSICRGLQLSARNKKWNREWRRDFEKGSQQKRFPSWWEIE